MLWVTLQLPSCSPCCCSSLSHSLLHHSSSPRFDAASHDIMCGAVPVSWSPGDGLSIMRAQRRGGGEEGEGRRRRKEFRVGRLKFATRCLGGDKNESGDNKPETLFMRELRKRGLAPTSTTDDGSDSGMLGTGTKTREGESEDDASGRGSDPFGASSKLPPKWTDERDKSNQRQHSMDLNSEGLDGLIPRGLELIKLGGAFWLAFWPLILATISTFIACYLYFGATFVHNGDGISGRPPYVDPFQLLEEEVLPSEVGPNRVPYGAYSSPQ